MLTVILLTIVSSVVAIAGEEFSQDLPQWRLNPLDIREPISYYVEPPHCDRGGKATDRWLAERALQAWDGATGGLLCFYETSASEARLRIYWRQTYDKLGRMQMIVEDTVRAAEVYSSLGDVGANQIQLGRAIEADLKMRDVFVYRTLLHEIGHALGMIHSLNLDDTMYFGGDVVSFYKRQREAITAIDDLFFVTGLSKVDKARIRSLYRPEALVEKPSPKTPEDLTEAVH